MSSLEILVVELISLAVRLAPTVVEAITGTSRATLDERIARALAAVRDPIDTTAQDTARRAELERIVRGEN